MTEIINIFIKNKGLSMKLSSFIQSSSRKIFYWRTILILAIIGITPSITWAVDLVTTGTTLVLANQVQDAFESGQYAFVLIVLLMVGLQIAKSLGGRRCPTLKKHAAPYSAGIGALIGGSAANITGSDPMMGALGGLMAGNAASGLYSTLKPILLSIGNLGVLLPIVGIGGSLIYALYKALIKSPTEKRRENLESLKSAMNKMHEDQPSTKELEAWISKHISQ